MFQLCLEISRAEVHGVGLFVPATMRPVSTEMLISIEPSGMQ